MSERPVRDSDTIDKCDPDQHPSAPSQLFLLRVWQSSMSGKKDCQGKLQNSVTGESRYFRSCDELRQILSVFMDPDIDGQEKRPQVGDKSQTAWNGRNGGQELVQPY